MFKMKGGFFISPEAGFGYSGGSLSIDFLVVKCFFLENNVLNKKI